MVGTSPVAVRATKAPRHGFVVSGQRIVDVGDEQPVHAGELRLRPVDGDVARVLEGLFHEGAGRILQRGSHAELLAQPGYYRELEEIQRLEAELEATS